MRERLLLMLKGSLCPVCDERSRDVVRHFVVWKHSMAGAGPLPPADHRAG